MNSISRRDFIRGTVAGVAAATLPLPSFAAQASDPTRWPIGCFNRPWTKWTLDETLDAIKAAGYQSMGLLTPTKDDAFTTGRATPDYLAALNQKARDPIFREACQDLRK